MTSVDPSIRGWRLVLILSSIPQLCIKCFQNLDVTLGSQSETTDSGIPCRRKIWWKKQSATTFAVSPLLEGTSLMRFENLSTKVVMQLYLCFVKGRCVMKSIAIEPHLLVGSSSGWGVLYGSCLSSLDRWHVSHPRQYYSTSETLLFQRKMLNLASVLLYSKCPDILLSCTRCSRSRPSFRGTKIFPSWCRTPSCFLKYGISRRTLSFCVGSSGWIPFRALQISEKTMSCS